MSKLISALGLISGMAANCVLVLAFTAFLDFCGLNKYFAMWVSAMAAYPLACMAQKYAEKGLTKLLARARK